MKSVNQIGIVRSQILETYYELLKILNNYDTIYYSGFDLLI